MLVPATFAESTSPSPGNVPPVIATVAPARLRLSTSDTTADGDSVTGDPFSVKDASAVQARVGGSLTAVMLTVVVTLAVALLAPPSSSVQVTVRVGAEPKSVGLSLVVTKVTESSTC